MTYYKMTAQQFWSFNKDDKGKIREWVEDQGLPSGRVSEVRIYPGENRLVAECFIRNEEDTGLAGDENGPFIEVREVELRTPRPMLSVVGEVMWEELKCTS